NPGRINLIHNNLLEIPESNRVTGRSQAALTAEPDREDRPTARDLGNPLLQLAERDQLRARNMAGEVFPGLPDIEHKRRWVRAEPFVELGDGDRRHRGHLPILWPQREAARAQGCASTLRRISQREQGPAVSGILR